MAISIPYFSATISGRERTFFVRQLALLLQSGVSLSDALSLHEAPFWSASQADFLQQAIKEDADWALIVDELSVMLRA